MTHKRLKKTMTAALCCALVFTQAAALSSCTTSHPEVQMKLSFNDKTYTLDYELYRKIAPSTVTHFLELADAEYYDGLCVHNYTESKWYMGGYSFDENKTSHGGLTEKNYFESVKGLKLTSTVWQDEEKQHSTNTLYGEYSVNGFKVKSGALQQSFGSLTMYYTSKSEVIGKVFTKRSDGKGVDMKDYRNNSATSLFYLSASTTTSAASSSYCTFATLKSDSKSALEDLKEAIADYIEAQTEENSEYAFAPSVEGIPSDTGDAFMDGGEERTYAVPLKPIVIKSVRVKKY